MSFSNSPNCLPEIVSDIRIKTTKMLYIFANLTFLFTTAKNKILRISLSVRLLLFMRGVLSNESHPNAEESEHYSLHLNCTCEGT